MTYEWQNYDAEQVRTQNENGVRLALSFAKDYKEYFNQELSCINCKSGFKESFQNYIKAMGLEPKKSEYQLKPKYDGISLGFGKKGRVFNKSITKKDAEYLLKNHPSGENLFDSLPEKAKAKDTVDDYSKLKVDEIKDLLDEKEIEYDAKATKSELLELLK